MNTFAADGTLLETTGVLVLRTLQAGPMDIGSLGRETGCDRDELVLALRMLLDERSVDGAPGPHGGILWRRTAVDPPLIRRRRWLLGGPNTRSFGAFKGRNFTP